MFESIELIKHENRLGVYLVFIGRESYNPIRSSITKKARTPSLVGSPQALDHAGNRDSMFGMSLLETRAGFVDMGLTEYGSSVVPLQKQQIGAEGFGCF